MFEKLSVDRSYETFYRDTTKHKSIKVLAKIDGEYWYDISQYVKKVTVNNQIQLLDVPTIDMAKLTVKNDNNAFTSTVYNDEFNPSAGKINGTIEQGYLNKVWEVQVYTVIYDVDNRDCLDLPDGAIAYFRYTLVDVVNGITPVGYELTPDTLLDVAIPLFRGWKPSQAIVEKHKEAEIELKDILWITTQKRLKNPLLYTSMTPSAIIADLLNRCGLESSYQDLQTLNTTFDVFIAEQDKSYWQIIQQICEATAGIISTSPDGKILYRTRIENFTDPEIALTINQDTFSKYNLEQKAKYNQLKVESEGYEISASNEDLLVDTTLTGDAAIIRAGQTQNFEFEYTSEFAKDFADTVFITVKMGDTIVDNLGAFSQGDDDGFIRVNKLTAYPDKLVLNITNLASTVDYTIAQVRFRGRQIKKLSLNSVEELNVTDEPDNEISIKSYYSDTSILSNIIDSLKFNINKDIVFSLSLNEFYPDIFAGNLVNFNIPLKGIASGTFIIEQIKHIINDDLSYNTELVISEWKDVVFDINSKEIYKSTPVEVITESSNQSQIEEIVGSISELQEDMQEQQNITSYLDGVAPNTPTGLVVTTEVINRESVLKVSFNPNSETDLLGYEIAYSQDGIWWQYNTVSETNVYIQVIGNTQYYVKVRAFDAEGYKSAWTSVESILSAKDTIPPEAPTGLTVEPLFQKIIVKWTPNTEPDLAKYKVEVSLDNFATVLDTIYTESNYVVYGGNTNTTYYFRVSAIDLSENESGYSMIVSGTTVAVYDADIESAILDGLAADMNELNTVTLPALQNDLLGLQDLTGYLDGEAPATPTGLALSTELLNNESVIKVSFNANTETDVIGYEIAYSTDQVKWHYVTTTDTIVYLSVIANTLYYVRIRAFDAEGFKSAWTNIASITSAKDITAPTTPTGLTAEALFQKIILRWSPNTETDFNKYKIQVSTNNFSSVKETFYTSSNYLVYSGTTNTTYQFRVLAIDTSGNESSYSTIINATTTAVYDEDLESQILDGLEADLNELNTVTLPNLQTELDSKLDDLPNEITETHIANNSISAPKIQANAITADKILANAVTSDKIAANAITANKVGANQIITNTANIANGIIDTVHIKDAAIQTTKIRDAAVTNAKIANLAVDDAKIANLDAAKITSGYIDADRIDANSITVSKLVAKPAFSIPEGAIAYFTDSLVDNVSGITPIGYDEINLSPKITLMPENAPEGSIIAPLMVADKIYADHIASNAITSEKIAASAVTTDKLNANAVTADKIAANAITADKILANAVTSDKIAANAITANKIGTNQIITNSANIANGIIDTAHIKDAAIETAKIKDAAITNAKIANLAVDDAKIANLNAAKINAGYISADRIASNAITSAKIAAGAITAEKVASNAITADKIAANSITSAKIAAGAVTADKIASNFTISAGQYIQAGTADRNYKLDGTQGLIRGIYGTNYNIPVIIKKGIIHFSGDVIRVYVDVSDLYLTDYFVSLVPVHNRPYGTIGEYNVQPTLFWKIFDSDEFYIDWIYILPNAWGSVTYSEYSNTVQSVWSSWITLGTSNNKGVKVTIRYYKSGVLYATKTATHYTAWDPAPIKIRHRRTTRSIESEIDWGDGVISTKILNTNEAPNITTASGQITQTCTTNWFYVQGDVSYTIFGY